MPPAIVGVAALAGAELATGAVIAAGWVAAGGLGASLVYAGSVMALSYLGNTLIGQPDAPQISAGQFTQGILLNKAGNAAPLPVIYGRRRVGGLRVFTEVSGENNEYLHLVLALAEGPVAAINTVYLNDVPSTDARFNGLVTVWRHEGTDNQTADSPLMTACPASWTAAHRLQGVAYIYCVLKWDANAFPGGLPTITADVDGRTVYDPRDSTTHFSRNPALCIRDYLTHARYGRGIPVAMISDSDIIAAANYCDEQVVVGGVSQARYTCDGLINIDDSALTNANNLLTSCRGMLVFAGGQYRLIIDKVDSSVFDFTEDNITGAWTISLGAKKNKFNRLRTRFFNPAKAWQPDIVPVESTDLRALDNGIVLERESELPFTADINTARQITTINLNQSRLMTTCQFTAFLAGLRCEVGNVVRITHSTPGWQAKKFRILNMSLKNNDEVVVTAREYADAVYDFGIIAAVSPAPATSLPNLQTAAPPENLVVTTVSYVAENALLYRATLIWNPPADAFVASYDVEYQLSGGSWTYAGNTKAASMVISGLIPGEYNFRVRSVNTLFVGSAWAYYGNLDISTATVPPAAPSPQAAIAGEIVTISWADCQTTLPISHYLVNGVNCGPGLLYRQRINWVGAQVFTVAAVDIAGNTSATGSVTVTTATVPAATAILCTGRAYAIDLGISYEDFATFAAIEIWAALANDRSQAVHLGDTTSGLFRHAGLPLIATRYYWARTRDAYGNYGLWYPESPTDGVMASTSTDPADYLALLQGHLSEAELTDALNNRIDWVDSQEFVFEGEVFEPGTFDGLNGVFRGLMALVGNHDSRLSYAEAGLLTVQSGEWASIADRLLISSYDAEQKANGYLRVAALENRLAVYDTTDAPDYSALSTYQPGRIVRQAGAYYRCKQANTTGHAPPDASYWEPITAGLVAQWVLKMNVNGHIAGVGLLLDDGGNSEFAILANKFKVVHPSDTGAPVEVFTVGEINGANAVGINGNLIIDGTIMARHLAVGTLSLTNVTDKSLANLDAAAATKLSGIAAGADVTANNTAAAIAGQGALATKSSVDLSTTDVANKSLGNVDSAAATKLAGIAAGADVTLSALNGGLEVTGGGVTLRSNASFKVYDGSNILRVELGKLS